MWARNKTQSGVKYTQQQLAVLTATVYGILEEADHELEKDAECEFHDNQWLNGLTNGEYFHTIAGLLREMLDDSPSREHAAFENAVLHSVFERLEWDFINFVQDYMPLRGAIWGLYKACMENANQPLWENEEHESIEPPPLDQIDQNQWKKIFFHIHAAFFDDDTWTLDTFGENYTMREEQPHWPTFQEYRAAKKWIRSVGENVTREWE